MFSIARSEWSAIGPSISATAISGAPSVMPISLGSPTRRAKASGFGPASARADMVSTLTTIGVHAIAIRVWLRLINRVCDCKRDRRPPSPLDDVGGSSCHDEMGLHNASAPAQGVTLAAILELQLHRPPPLILGICSTGLNTESPSRTIRIA